MTKKFSYEYVKEFISNNNYILLENDYVNSFTKMNIGDENSYKYFLSYASFRETIKIGGKLLKWGTKNIYTIHNIKNYLLKNNPTLSIIEFSIDFLKDRNIKLYCSKCREEFIEDWTHVVTWKKCPYCNGNRVGKYNNLLYLNPEKAKDWDYERNFKNPENYTVSSNQVVNWICAKCGHNWKTTINSKRGCPVCMNRIASDKNSLASLFPEIAVEWDYDKNIKTPNDYTYGSEHMSYWICKQCGAKWKATINNRTNIHSGCKICGASGGAKKIYEWLDNNGFSNKFYYDKTVFDDLIGEFGIPLRYDFVIYDNENKSKIILIIEFDGLQHEIYSKHIHKTKKEFFRLQRYDQIKNEYAKSHRYKMIRISDRNFDNIETILEEALNLHQEGKEV